MKLKPLWKEACLASVVITCAWESACYAVQPLIIDIERPAEFESFNEPREIVADIYYGERYLATQLVTYTPEWVKLSNSQQIVDKVPDITSPDVILDTLKKQLDTHSSLVCHTEKQENCGHLSPDTAGIIFDLSRLQIHLYINADYLKFNPATTKLFLPPSDADKSFIQKINGVMSGTRSSKSGQSALSNSNRKKPALNYTLRGRSLVAFKENNMQLNYDYSENNQLSLNSVLFNREFEGKQWQAGLLSTRGFGMAFSGDKAVWGARLASSMNTQIDRELSQSSSLQIFMPVRGTIDVLRDGKLMYTISKEVGNYFLDTSRFDPGAYNVTINIHDVSGNLVSEQTRFFVKDYALPKKGVPFFFLEGGRVVNRDTASILPKTSPEWITRAGVNYRLSETWAGSAVVAATQKQHFSELTLFNMGEHYKVTPGVLFSADGSYGSKLMLNLYWQNITVNFNHRFLRNKNNNNKIKTGINTFRLLENSLNQSNFGIAFPLFKGEISYDETRRRQEGFKNLKIKSLSYSRNILRDSRYTLNSRFSCSQSSTGNKLFQLFLDFRLNDENTTHGLTSLSNLQKYSGSSGQGRISKDNNLRYDLHWHKDDFSGQEVDTHLSAQKSKQQTFFLGSANLYSDYGHFVGVLSQSYNKGMGNATNYSANFDTHFATEGNYYSVGGYHYDDSGLIVNVKGINTKDNFSVLVNGKKEGVAHGNWHSMIPLSPFSTYNISLKPMNHGFYRFNESIRQVTLYPGNVVAMDYDIQSFRLVFGQMLDESGKPLAGAQIKDNASFNNQTNEYGLFQLELPYDVKSVVFTKEGKSCTLQLPENSDQEIVNIGTVKCQSLL